MKKSIVFKLGGHTFELKNLKEQDCGFGDSLGFTGDAYLGGDYLGEVYNDGRGAFGYLKLSTNEQKLKEDYKNFNDMLCSTTWKTYDYGGGNVKDIKYDMGFLLDCMAFNALVCNQNEYKSE